MNIKISGYYKGSFAELAVRNGISIEEQITGTRKHQLDKLLSFVGTSVSESSEKLDILSDDFWHSQEQSIVNVFAPSFDLLKNIIPHITPSDKSILGQTHNHIVTALIDFFTTTPTLNLNIVGGYGLSTGFNYASTSREEITIDYDFQLTEALILINKYYLKFFLRFNGLDFELNSDEERLSLVKAYPFERLLNAGFMIGKTEAIFEEFEFMPSEKMDALKNSAAGITFMIFHELIHHILKHYFSREQIPLEETEMLCDDIASLIIAIAIREDLIDWVEALTGITSVFFLQYLKSIYLQQGQGSSGKYPKVEKRLERAFSILSINQVCRNYPLKDVWNTLVPAFYDYVVIWQKLLTLGSQPVIFLGKYFAASLSESDAKIFPY